MRRLRLSPLAGLALLLAGCDLASPIHSPLVILSPGATGAPAPAIDPAGGEAAIRPLAERHAARQGLPVGLVMAVIAQESGFRPGAVSPAGAQGLMQLMPITVQHINQVGEVTVADPFDPEQNVAGGSWYLKWVKGQVPASKVAEGEAWRFALGGYNAGIGRVQGAIDLALAGAPRNPTVRWEDVAAKLPAETQRYVPAVEAKWARYGRD